MLNARITELTEAIERKEFLFQLKEQKWAAIEKIMVDYAREDENLQRMLADLRYICDDVSTRRNVKNVLQENVILKKEIEKQKHTINVLSSRMQETMITGTSNEIDKTCSDSKKGISDESRKLPDLNCFNVKVVNNQIKFLKKSELERYETQIKHLENVIDEKCIEIRDLKSSMFDLSDTNSKVMRRMKELKKKNAKCRKQTIDLRSQLKKLCRVKTNIKSHHIKDILDDIEEDCFSDEEARSVSYPNNKANSPFKKMEKASARKFRIGYHRDRYNKNCESMENGEEVNIKFDVQDVFLPQQTLGVEEFSDLKKGVKQNLNECHVKKIDFKKLDLYSDDEDENVLFRSPVRRNQDLNDSVV